MRTVAAALVAPLAVIPVLLVLFGPWALAHGGARTLSGILEPAVLLAYPLLILFGLPLHFALAQQRLTRPRHYAVAGLLAGALPMIGYLIVAVLFEAKFALAGIPMALARNIEWGVIGALVFGLCSSAVAVAFRATAFPS